MSPEERPDQIEALNEHVDALLDGRKPPYPRQMKVDDGEMLRMAALLASSQTPKSQPSAAFVDQLRQRFDPDRRQWWNVRVTRRGLAGLAASAGAVAAALVGRGVWQRFGAGSSVPAGWVPVAQAAELPPGSVKRFTAGEVQGHVMNIGGKVWALSAVCTHLACTLEWDQPHADFLCPCHGAEFDTNGQQTGAEAYGYDLPPLPRIPVQQLNGAIYVIPT